MPKKRFSQSDSVEIRLNQSSKIKVKKKNFRLTAKQVQLLGMILDPENKIIFISGAAGTSKAQPLDAKVLTPDGYVDMGSLSVGDLVFAQNGKPTKVVGVFPQGKKEIYKIKFSDGTSTECCGDHLWHTTTSYDRNYRVKKSGEIFKQKRAGGVKTTDEIRNSLFVRGRVNHAIPICEPVQFATKELFLDPYIMGILLGDGCLVQKTSFSTKDIEIVNNISEKLPNGFAVKKVESSQCDYSIVSEGSHVNEITDFIRELKLNVKSAFKFIPEEYLLGDINQRIELLRGLMDSDGTISNNKTQTASHESFSSVSQDLINGVKFLVQSLGGTATISSPQQSYYYNQDGEKVLCQDYFTAHLNFNPEINPFLLTRKSQRYIPKSKYPPRRYIVDVEKVSEKECQCIMVEDESHLYLTNDFIVTHNTYMALYGAIEMMSEDADKQLIYIRSIIESADKGLGSLPGDIAEKFDPFLMPLYDKLEEIVAPQDVAHLKSVGRISAVPINFLRGASWNNKIIVADESQNFSAKELITLITRIGEGSKIIICGDPMQSDIGKAKSGFIPMLNAFNDQESKQQGIQAFMFSKEDIVRSEILKFIVKKLEEVDFHV
jgi:hypothetical protein